jgi:hypothetical protein
MSTTADANYIYISPDKKVKIILIEEDEHGIIRVSGDVASSSRPTTYHHTEIIIDNGWIRFSCSCEAGAHGFLCHHVNELYNVYRKNLMEIKEVRRNG